MIRIAVAMAATIALATLAAGATTPDDPLQKLLAGKQAGTPRRCIMPDLSAQPRIIDGQAIVYWRGPETYVGRFHGGCPQLREDRTIVTSTLNGQLCANDQVRVVQAGVAGSGFGFCTFDGFTPYRK